MHGAYWKSAIIQSCSWRSDDEIVARGGRSGDTQLTAASVIYHGTCVLCLDRMRFYVSRPLIRMRNTHLQAELCAWSSKVTRGVMVRTQYCSQGQVQDQGQGMDISFFSPCLKVANTFVLSLRAGPTQQVLARYRVKVALRHTHIILPSVTLQYQRTSDQAQSSKTKVFVTFKKKKKKRE